MTAELRNKSDVELQFHLDNNRWPDEQEVLLLDTAQDGRRIVIAKERYMGGGIRNPASFPTSSSVINAQVLTAAAAGLEFKSQSRMESRGWRRAWARAA